MAEKFTIVAGNLGTGKTSLVERIGVRLNWHVMQEPVTDNPYLTDFYADMHTWSFHLQIYFLSHRAKQHLEISTIDQSVIMDRSVYECAYVFAPALHHQGYITDRDYKTYLQVFDLVARNLPMPDLLVYLKAPLETLIERIQKRGLGFDYKGITKEYLALIGSFYEKWVQTFDLCPVLTLNTDYVDYINDPECLEEVAHKIVNLVENSDRRFRHVQI